MQELQLKSEISPWSSEGELSLANSTFLLNSPNSAIKTESGTSTRFQRVTRLELGLRRMDGRCDDFVGGVMGGPK